MKWLRPFILFALAGFGSLAPGLRCRQTAAPGDGVLLRLEPERWALENFVLSEDAARFTCVQRVGETDWYVVVDGKRSKRYDVIRSGDPEFSPDGRRVAYGVRQDGGVFVFVDGKPGRRYDDLGPGRLFSPDGRRVAYIAREGTRAMLVEDGRESARYDGIGAYAMSPEGNRTAFVARRGDRWFVVVDGRESPAYDVVLKNSLAFSPDGGRFAYAAARGDTWLVVVDDSEAMRHSGASYLTFSPDSRRFAYLARGLGEERWRVHCDGVPGLSFRSLVNGPAFSPDSRRLAYGIELDDGRAAVVVDDTTGPGFFDLGRDSTIVFSPDSRRLAHFARLDPAGWTLVVDDTTGPVSEQVGLAPVFSPDSRRIAWRARFGPTGRVFVDGAADTVELNGVEPGSLCFSPDSRHYAYAGWRVTEWYTVLDGVPGEAHETPLVCGTRLGFRPDGELVHLARRGNDVLLVRTRPR